MRYLFGLLLFLIVCGAAQNDKWEWRAGDYAVQAKYQKSDYFCRHKVRDLGKEMYDVGVPFMVAVGKRCLSEHCWIIYKGKILEPTCLADDPSLYNTEGLYSYPEFLALWKAKGWK